jgi:hypothetical protein
MTRSKSTSTTSGGARLLLAVLASGATLLALGAASASASPTNLQRATGTCWRDVLNDWIQHQPNVLGTYPIACYTQAIQHLNAYVDVRQYSNAPDDIHRALLAAIQNNRGDGGNNGSSPVGPSSSGGGGPTGTGGGPTAGGGTLGATHKSLVTRLFDSVGPGDAQSIPLPLLVLAGLAVLLLLAAAGTWLAKRVQARRIAPAPAPAPRQ